MADWSNLNNDLLELITKRLALPDYLRLGAVCKNWLLFTKATSFRPTHQLPWLILGQEKNSKKRAFFSLSEEKHYYIDIPELYGHVCRGSSYGWLFTVDEDINGHLVNPFTRKCYHMPPFLPFGKLPDVRTLKEDERVEWQLNVVTKALLSNNPSENQDFTVVILYGLPPKVAFWRPTNSNWILVGSDRNYGLIRDIVFFKDKLYALVASLMLTVVDLGADPKMTIVDPWTPKYEISSEDYLVDFKGEFLLLIRMIQDEVEDDHYFTKEFLIYEFNLEGRAMCDWYDIGSSVIFLGTSSNVVNHGECSSCRPDSIYFTAINALNYSDERYGLDDHGFYDIVNKTIGKYYPSEIFLNRQASPIWFVPNAN